MMQTTTVQRISRVLGYYAKGNTVKTVTASNASDVLDLLDDLACIDTKYIDGHFCNRGWDCAGDHEEPRQLGARVALHEKIAWGDVIALPQPVENIPYFWLGRDAEIHAY